MHSDDQGPLPIVGAYEANRSALRKREDERRVALRYVALALEPGYKKEELSDNTNAVSNRKSDSFPMIILELVAKCLFIYLLVL